MSEDPPTDRASRIAALNDDFRKSFANGTVFVTVGVQVLGCKAVKEAINAVRAFDRFSADNDPHGEHDFGVITVEGLRLFWKIDYYDPMLEYASPDPTDPAKTRRVLTIMLAEEY